MGRPKVRAITGKVLDMIIAAAKETHPNEFVCALRADGDTINEILLLPGAIQGDSHALFNLHHLPVDFSIVGIAHSHPVPDDTPSEEDLRTFSNFGSVQIIIGFPYNRSTWTAYSREGDAMRLEVV
jgi:proteasome lid subunit RPN8/RPN11